MSTDKSCCDKGNDTMDKVIGLRHLLHQNAELSLHEDNTRKIISDFIRTNTPLTPVEEDGCVYAIYDTGAEKNVALRADIDALPIAESEGEYRSQNSHVSHRCGHDGHTAALCGAMAELTRNGCKNNVVFIFQKGEEIGAGGECAAAILKRFGVSRVYGWHNIPGFERGSVLMREGTFCCGSCGIIVELEGTSAHAAYPEYGVSPADTIESILSFVRTLNERNTRGLLHCTVIGIDCGGSDFGIAAYSGKVMLTLRGEHNDEYEDAKAELEDFVRQCAEKNLLKCSISYSDVFPPAENSLNAVHTLEQVCIENNFKYIKPDEPFRWSEDFGYYTRELDGCFFGIGDGENYPTLHTMQYDFPDEILKRAVKLLVCLANT